MSLVAGPLRGLGHIVGPRAEGAAAACGDVASFGEFLGRTTAAHAIGGAARGGEAI